MAMLGDGMKSYDNNKDGSDTELAGCEVKIGTFPPSWGQYTHTFFL